MKKQDKKRDNAIRKALTAVCETLLDSQPGFVWLTHKVDYKRFPQSLTIVLIFENDSQMQQCKVKALPDIGRLVTSHLSEAGIIVPCIDRHLHFDSEAACKADHNGNWARRLSGH
ncbi:Fis family transcriptional regulator [Alteromonas sp. H39]|uniref:Fis family transcriptional regulator n=1 Tax=Alteromonas sp. H39 TaxID=3389876 RepID=UPI0039E0AC83